MKTEPITYPAATRAPVTIQNKAGDVIRTSKNLQGILRYASSVSPILNVRCEASQPFGSNDTYYNVEFTFRDGSIGFTVWASWRVLCDWIKARHSWRGAVNDVQGMVEFKTAMRPYMEKYSGRTFL